MSAIRSSFRSNHHAAEFCATCGAILPLPSGGSSFNLLKCIACGHAISISVFDGTTSMTKIVFNKSDNMLVEKKGMNKGPVVERKCRKCPSEKMFYFTLQTRSADEGQTVFYTCCECGSQENENS
ncbi:DNA-directed RNA polymerase I subunit RPA12-like [Panonychus citri]|uniref:DNA-directed RNA polymerase I subunit RPA12-like n=1 Tax=Panonychus citri TaxID=50023 RepID=UPI0023080112|nr:DNA-directed RNA polymerase I subunit RPA12-like [Panonychus citri]